MEYLSLSRRRERVGISSHCGSGSEAKLRRLEWNGDKRYVKIVYWQPFTKLRLALDNT